MPDFDVETKVLGHLDKLLISYQLVRHDPAMTMADLTEVGRRLGADHPKNLFLCNRQKTVFYLLLLDKDKQFRTADVSRQLGVARLSFAGPDQLWQMLRTRPGAISPLGLIFDKEREVRLLVDEDLQKSSSLSFHPCVNRSSLALSSHDFFKVFLPDCGHAPEYVQIRD